MLQGAWQGFRILERGKRYVWEGQIQPTPHSSKYTVRIEYADWQVPKVWVIDPPLRQLPGQEIPHRHREGNLCLHLPEEWSSTQYIAHTILPWIPVWLYYYEVWRITGEWRGGGHSIGPKEVTHEEHEKLSHPVD